MNLNIRAGLQNPPTPSGALATIAVASAACSAEPDRVGFGRPGRSACSELEEPAGPHVVLGATALSETPVSAGALAATAAEPAEPKRSEFEPDPWRSELRVSAACRTGT